MNFDSTHSNPKVVKSFGVDKDLFCSLCGLFSIIFDLYEACFPSPGLDRNPSECQKILKCRERSSARVHFSFRWSSNWFASLEPGFSISSACWGQIYHCVLRDLNVLLSDSHKVEGVFWLHKEQ